MIEEVLEMKKDMEKSHVAAYAAQSAYFIILSFLPLIILLLSVIQFTGIGKADLYGLIRDVVPAGFQGWLFGIIDEMYSRTVATVSISALVTVWSAGKSFMALNRGMNAICHVEKKQNYIQMRLRGAVFALLFVLLIVATLVLVVFGASIHELFAGDFYPDYSVLPHGGDAGAVHLFLCAFVYGASQPARRLCRTVPGSDFCGIGMVSVFLWLFHLYSVQPCIQYVWQSDNTGAPHVLAVRGHVYCADRNGSEPLAGRAGDRTSLVEG